MTGSVDRNVFSYLLSQIPVVLSVIMLQNDAIRNLYQDTGADMSQQTFKESNVLDDPDNITFQPRAQRLPLPVTRVESNIGTTTYVPITGYDFLKDLPSAHIEQTFEFNDSLTAICPESRFIVRSPLGEALYAVTESSTQTNFLMCGSWCPFQLHVIDKTYQEALLLRKSFALSSLCCLSKQLEVWVPPGHLLGRVVQSPISLKPQYFIEDGSTGMSINIFITDFNSKRQHNFEGKNHLTNF
uniref:Phospholipid scramblase n=1 Tax=Glossina morsitans morsitans TaxID=37546 RepID=A0A1B0FIP1_GLOMM